MAEYVHTCCCQLNHWACAVCNYTLKCRDCSMALSKSPHLLTLFNSNINYTDHICFKREHSITHKTMCTFIISHAVNSILNAENTNENWSESWWAKAQANAKPFWGQGYSVLSSSCPSGFEDCPQGVHPWQLKDPWSVERLESHNNNNIIIHKILSRNV